MKILLNVYSKKLIANRLLRNDDEIEAFKNAREAILKRKNPKDISIFCQAFDDETEDYEVMFGIVHDIEAYDNISSTEIATEQFVISIPFMAEKATEWLEVLLFRILNDDNSRLVFAQILGSSDTSLRSYTLKVLQKIAQEDPEEFREKVDEVINNM